MVGGLAEEYAALLSGKDIRLDNSVPPELQLTADRNVVCTVFRNLLDNASKYTPSGGSISVAASEQAEMVVVTVTNTGVFLSAKDIEHILERSDPTSQSSVAGSVSTRGFGLYLVRELMTLHGGSLEIFSGAGSGVVVELSFP